MSLILDALRRADRERERERGGVPSLYAPAAPPWTPAADASTDRAPRPWLWLGAGLGGGLVLAAVWALWSATPVEPVAANAPPPAVPGVPAAGGTPPATPAPMAQAADPAPAAPSPTPSRDLPASPALPRAERPAEPDAAAAPAGIAQREAPRSEQAPTAPPREAPVERRQVDAKPAPAARDASRAEPPPRRDAATPEAPAGRGGASRAAAPVAAAPPIRSLRDLPADVRSQLPQLAIGGSMYSSKAANRRLIVNGQLLSEGDPVAPGLVLEEIRLKSAVLRWRDLRYEQDF
ncbi:MAG TPA: general secretion pathway protein GspB [Methylibium sp.]|uniref:general secretion pathway protein GspB n=1 Tax=Methylibium sp. TaxID=2067992 RepID=UPI002DBBAED6|nr:general secretion pathway protein GspB [Methylibium sp.]HEU4458291.1 general secretion pathway protein GspB [Methylibium sp.]